MARKLTMANGMVQVRLEWGDEWANGKFQNAFESVHSGHTEWVCGCLSGHRVGVRMLEWAGSTARKRVVPRELHGRYTVVGAR